MSDKATAAKSALPSTPLTPGFPVPDSLFSRLIVAPVLFVSFLISLFLIDRKTYGSIFTHDWHASHREDYYHSNKRKIARHELEEAFQIRSRVIAGIVLVSGVLVALLGWSSSRLVSSMIWGMPIKYFHLYD